MPTKSRWNLPIPECTLPSFLFESPTAQLSEKPMFIDADRPETVYLTLSTLRLWAQRLAAGLQAKGLKRGDRVMLYSGNTIFFPVVFLGIIMSGGIYTGANPAYTANELAFQLKNSGATYLIASEASFDTALNAIQQVDGFSKERLFVYDDGYDTWEGKGRPLKGCQHWSKLLASEEEGKNLHWREGKQYVDDTIALNYSSGTTGFPKGVEITHKCYVSNAKQHMFLQTLKDNWEQKRHNMRWLCFLPLYHAMAQTIFCVGAPYLRIPVYLMKKFDFVKMLQAVQDFRITELQLVPPIVVMMAKRPETKKFDLSSVEGAGCGAAPLGREIVVEFESLWPNGQVNMKQGWGMTETTCSILGWDPSQHCENYSVGEPNPNTQVKLINTEDNQTEVPDGTRGEIWAKGPNIMKRYWNNASATKETITSDGWLRTGDIAYKDENGMFFIVDRMKELIKVKGMQVAPAELEAQLLEHPNVSDACVVGVTVEGDEQPRAYVCQADGKTVSPQDVVKFMEQRLTRHKWLTGGVKVVNEIQKNPSGKILRKFYREQAKQEIGDSAKKESRL